MADILTSGARGILKKVAFAVSENIGLAWGVKDDLKKLQDTVQMILAVIRDAENRQVTEEAVRLWLRRLKSIAYDADDVMDEFFYETMRCSERGNQLKHKISNFVSSHNPLVFRFKLARKIKKINNKLDDVTRQMCTFRLQPDDTSIVHGESSDPLDRQTVSFANESEIVGREEDKHNIINLLTVEAASSGNNSESISVISIVGMGGIGKTTLAQQVYHDELVTNYFEPRIWVCVSDDFDISKLLVNIMESITNKKYEEPSNFSVLVGNVRAKLTGKKYFLVLDDMWNEDAQQWDAFKSMLAVGAQGSKILITTRQNQVAKVAEGSIPPYELKLLETGECWSIIQTRAFSPGGAEKTNKMNNIGEEIARKCGGLPLAAKILGGLMRLKNTETDWLMITESDIWNTPGIHSKIILILKLSYDNLSYPLKLCFSYCSMFPRDWEINREHLIQLWRAEGFLGLPNVPAGISIEDIGNEYFDRLVLSAFFDGVKRNDLGDIRTCKMHDLVHNLAQSVAEDHECISLKVSEFIDVSQARRLQLTLDEEFSAVSAETLSDAKKLRTFIVLKQTDSLAANDFSSNKHLRVLHLSSLGADLSCGIAKLKHLRYLNLVSFSLSKITKRHSISRLYNLQTLVISKCLHVQNLLKNMESLKNLRYLDISYTDVIELPNSVTSLHNLLSLDLNHCSNLTTFPNSITGLRYLKFLDMSFTPIKQLPNFVISLLKLQTLDVNSCEELKTLPEYVSGLQELRIFNFRNCPLINALPEDFGSLTQLRSLDLYGTEVTVLPESCSALYNLEFLNLNKCELPQDITKWAKLRLFYCFKKGTPTGIGKLERLQTLTYWLPEKVISEPECSNGIEHLGNLHFLQELLILELQNVKDLRDVRRANLKSKHNLNKLGMSWSEFGMDDNFLSFSHTVLEALQPPTNLRILKVCFYMGKVLPYWMHVPSCLPNLERLELEHCIYIHQLPPAIGKIRRLRFLNLVGMYLDNLDIVFSSLAELRLTDMFCLKELSYSYPFLRDLRITGCKSLTRIPLFPSLQILQIINCNQFQGFRVDGELHSRSLRILNLQDCPVLRFLPDLRGWSSLQQLIIRRCPQIKDSFTGDLDSLSFIQRMEVDFLQTDQQSGDFMQELIDLILSSGVASTSS